ncbi:hypothetical protein PINS_up005701 [Pythium insidiosum]|nr:hypothetical protein PINS_up005701 [Pythium insidiosum]
MLSELERQTEQAFHHYVYVCFDESQDRRHTSGMGADSGSAALLVDASTSASTSSAGTDAARAHVRSSSSFLEIVEGVQRTFVFVNRATLRGCLRAGNNNNNNSAAPNAPSRDGTTHLIALLLQYSRGLLTTLHRRVRQRHERVLVVPVDLVNATRELQDDDHDEKEDVDDDDNDEGEEEGEEMRDNGHLQHASGAGVSETTLSPVSPRLQQLTHFTSALLLHFLVMGCGLTPLRAVAAFSRECLDVLHHAPPATVLQQLQDCFLQRQALRRSAAREQWTQRQRHVLSCHCGDKVLAVPTAALAAATPWSAPDTEAWRRWQTTVPSGAALDDELGRDPVVLERPQHAAVAPRPWLIVDSLSVERLESQLRATLHRVLGASTGATAVANVPPPSTHPRRSSLTTFLSRHMSPSSSSSSSSAAGRRRQPNGRCMRTCTT